MRNARRPTESAERAVEPPLPAVRARKRFGGRRVARAELEHDVEPARARTHQVDDEHAARELAQLAQRLALERRRELLAREILPALELAQKSRHVLVRTQVYTRRLADGRTLRVVRVAQ